MKIQRISGALLGSAAALALLLGSASLPMQTAIAQEWQGPQGGPGGQGKGGEGGGGSHEDGGEHEDGGGCDDGSHEDGGCGGGEEGHTPAGGEGKGRGGEGGAGGGEGGQGGQGGQPVWSHEGIPEVELGRLNVVRSPRTLDRALLEARSSFDPATMTRLYQARAVDFASAARLNWDSITIIDSPVQNLALLRELWRTQDTSLPGVDLSATNVIELSAIFLGVASDKTMPISNDTVRALATIFGVSMSDAVVAAIAGKAETVRQGVLAGHG